MNQSWIHYLPIATSVLSIAFTIVLIRAALVRRSGPHLWWCAFGAFSYGLGTIAEASITLAGNSVWQTKAWYITGALLGGYPLAQGAAFLHMKRKKAMLWGYITATFVVIASTLVILSPVNIRLLEPTRPSGAILSWHWVRLMTPFINLYAATFLIGGAVVSAVSFRKHPHMRHRYFGNVLIAVGALLPGIGGGMAKAGIVEALYVLELCGLILIWAGYGVIASYKAQPKTVEPVREQRVAVGAM